MQRARTKNAVSVSGKANPRRERAGCRRGGHHQRCSHRGSPADSRIRKRETPIRECRAARYRPCHCARVAVLWSYCHGGCASRSRCYRHIRRRNGERLGRRRNGHRNRAVRSRIGCIPGVCCGNCVRAGGHGRKVVSCGPIGQGKRRGLCRSIHGNCHGSRRHCRTGRQAGGHGNRNRVGRTGSRRRSCRSHRCVRSHWWHSDANRSARRQVGCVSSVSG